MSLVAQQEGGFSLFHLFEIISGTLQPLLACYGLFRVVSFFISNDVTECFSLQIYYKSTSYRFYYRIASVTIKWDSLKQGRHYKLGQVLKSGTRFFKKWGNNYKVMQYRRQMRETGESSRFQQLTPLFTQHFTPRNS